MQRYFVLKELDEVVFSPDDIFHITKVMRGKIGDTLEIVDQNQNLSLAAIASLQPFKVEISEKLNVNSELSNKITLYYVMAKGEKTDLVVQKATELGVNEIVLLNSKRSVVRLENSKLIAKTIRFQKIAKEAAEQAKRLIIPKVTLNPNFQVINEIQATLRLIADEDEAGTTNKLYTLLNNLPQRESVALLVGSEGGFEREEVEYAKKVGFKTISLGKRILRSETAAISLLAVVASYMERT